MPARAWSKGYAKLPRGQASITIPRIVVGVSNDQARVCGTPSGVAPRNSLVEGPRPAFRTGRAEQVLIATLARVVKVCPSRRRVDRIRGVTPQTRWSEVRARRGLVASPHALASEAGRSAFARGGNALDAAIAAAAAIAVVYPHMNGIGGDNVWLIYDAGRRRLRALNGIGRSAAAVDLADYAARFGAAIPPRGGPAALTVPGAVSGWWAAHTYSRDTMG